MAPQRVAKQAATHGKVPLGWLQVALPSAPAPESSAPESVDCFLPVNDPCLGPLTDRLRSDFPDASDVVFFAGATEWSGGQSLTSFLYARGWLLIARHRLASHGILTDHLVSTGWTISGPVPPDVCQHLTTCSFDRSGSIEAPDTILSELMEQARLLSADHARKRHRQRVKAEVPPPSQSPMSIVDLDRKLDVIERRAMKMRKRIAAIPFKTAEYQALDGELTTIIQQFHSTLRQRRTLWLQRRKEQPYSEGREKAAPDKLIETLEPLVLIRWRLEP